MAYTPTIHLGGTGRQTLLEQAYRAHEALKEAIEAMRAMSPNGRDFYPQGNDAIRKAMAEHASRLSTLQDIRAEVTSYIERVVDAPGRA